MAGYNTTVQTPVLDTPIVYDFPAEAGNLPPGGEVYFVLYNQSPYICEAATALDKQWCAAFTADAYVVPTQPYPKIIVTPQSNLGSDSPLAAQIYGTWYTRKDDLPLTTVPASLFGSTESILTDNPKLLAVELNRTATLGIGFTSGVIDVRRYQSFQMSVQWEAANAGPPANTMYLDLEWADDAAFSNVLHNQVFEINSFLSTDCGRTHIVDGHHGPFMRYHCEPANGGTSTVTLVLYGSSRPVENPRLQENGDADATGLGVDRTILICDAVTITPAANLERNCRIASGSGTVIIQTGAGGGSHDVVLYSPDIGIGARYYTSNIPAGINNVVERISLPRRAMALFVNNNGAANSTFWMSVTADGEG